MPITEITAGILPRGTSTTADQINWPSIITKLFNQIIINRELILDCIQSRQPFGNNKIASIQHLIDIFAEIKRNRESLWVIDERINCSIKRHKLLPEEMAPGFKVMFEAIASIISMQITLRTDERKQQELLRIYSDTDDAYGLGLKEFHHHLNAFVYQYVGQLIKNTLPYKLRAMKFAGYMRYVEGVYEQNKIALTSKCFTYSFSTKSEHFNSYVFPALVKRSNASFKDYYHTWLNLFYTRIERDRWLWQSLDNHKQRALTEFYTKTTRYLIDNLFIQKIPMCTIQEIRFLLDIVLNAEHMSHWRRFAALSTQEYQQIITNLPKLLHYFLIFESDRKHWVKNAAKFKDEVYTDEYLFLLAEIENLHKVARINTRRHGLIEYHGKNYSKDSKLYDFLRNYTLFLLDQPSLETSQLEFIRNNFMFASSIIRTDKHREQLVSLQPITHIAPRRSQSTGHLERRSGNTVGCTESIKRMFSPEPTSRRTFTAHQSDDTHDIIQTSP